MLLGFRCTFVALPTNSSSGCTVLVVRRPSAQLFLCTVLSSTGYITFTARCAGFTLCSCRHSLSIPYLYSKGSHVLSFLFLFSFISLIADGSHHYHPACGHKESSHLSPVHALQFFYRDASSALLQLVNQWLNFTYSRSHAFRYERKNTNPTLVRIELTTSVLADVQLTY